VGIPVWNGERYIRESIASVLAQTYTDFELIVTDDGSTDKTMEIVREFDDPRMVVVCDGMHKGLATRLNEQIAMAHGQYFARMDADDVMLPERLARQMAFVALHPETDVVGSSAIVIDEEGRHIGYRGGCNWKRGKNRQPGDLGYVTTSSFMHPTVMARTEWFRKYYYNPVCEGCEDLDLWSRSVADSHFYSLVEPLMLYRDPHLLDLKTYLYRRRQERYVLRINRERQSALTYNTKVIRSYAKSAATWTLSKIGLGNWVVKSRNVSYSPLNNHVLHVITSLRTGGAEKLMVDLLPRLREYGYEVELVVFDGVKTPFYEQLEKTGVRIHPLRIGGSVYDPRNLLALVPLMKKADIIHTHNTAPQLFAAIAHLVVKPRLFTTEHNTSNRRRNHSVLKPIDQWMYRQYERVICISDKAEENLKDYLSGNVEQNDRISTVYNGIDLSHFSKPGVSLQKNEATKVITMVAAFREQKDQPTLVRAMALLSDEYMLQLVGVGESRLMEQCAQLAEDLGIKKRVHLLGQRTDIPELLTASDVVVLSSHYEGLSLSSIEGMASGRPFIASDVDGLHEIVSGSGILFPHEDAEALATAIRRCCEDREYAAEIGRKCQQKAMQYDIALMAEKYIECYTK